MREISGTKDKAHGMQGELDARTKHQQSMKRTGTTMMQGYKTSEWIK